MGRYLRKSKLYTPLSGLYFKEKKTYTTVIIIQIANALFIDKYLGAKELISLPAGNTFSNTQEKSAE